MADTLILFSGGKDSFLTACREIKAGNAAKLISFNNGAVLGEQNLLHSAARLKNRYGPKAVQYIGCYNTSAVIHHLSGMHADTNWETLGSRYPNLINAQINCLHCQTAMWICAIAYASAHRIPAIAAGYRKSDLFCTGMPEYGRRMLHLAREFGCQVRFPVWDDDLWMQSPGGIERDFEMERNRFSPAVLEPKCMIGRPVKPMCDAAKQDVIRYIDEILLPVTESEIRHMQPVLKTLPIGPESMAVIEYPVPDGKNGIY